MINENETHAHELKQLKQDEEERSKELSTMRNRLNLLSQNWSKEREDLSQKQAYFREELAVAEQGRQDWEVLAMEERSIRQSLVERAADLEEQVNVLKENNQNLESTRSTQALNVDGLQRALRELQEGM